MTAPAAICKKKRRTGEIRKLRRQLGWIDIPVTYDRTDLTGLGHLPLFVNFAKLMGLEDAVASHLHLHRRERSDGFPAHSPAAPWRTETGLTGGSLSWMHNATPVRSTQGAGNDSGPSIRGDS